MKDKQLIRSCSSYLGAYVALPEMRDLYLYKIPASLDVVLGSYVEVPFGSRVLVGVVWELTNDLSVPFALKYILKVVCSFVLSEKNRQFVASVADHTMSSIGHILKMVIVNPQFLVSKVQYGFTLGIPVGDKKLTTQQKKVIEVLQHSVSPMSMSDLSAKAVVGNSVVRNLWRLQFIKMVIVDSLSDDKIIRQNRINKVTFNREQQQLYDKLRKSLLQADCALLHGVTGSGKTQLYQPYLLEILRTTNKQVLVLVPEIVNTNILIQQLRSTLGVDIIEWHSDLSLGLRKKNWQLITSGKARVIIGARSAIFLPYVSLGVVVVEEEHDSSYKQSERSCYHARDLAIKLANLWSVGVLLVSATPSLETVYRVISGKCLAFKLSNRYGNSTLPAIHLIDMRKKKLSFNKYISSCLSAAILDNFSRNKQSLLFLNRRGYTHFNVCSHCGYLLTCANCSSALVLYNCRNKLLCHLCGASYALFKSCPKCDYTGAIRNYSPGCEKLYEEVVELFPQMKVLLVTSDTMRGKTRSKEYHTLIHDNHVDLVIATQILAKGYDFPHLTLVAMIDADANYGNNNIRITEKTYQLFTQVIGRAGRRSFPGSVYIQTYQPNSNLLSYLSGDAWEFYSVELSYRHAANLPPFTRLIAIILQDKNKDLVADFADTLFINKPELGKIEILGPVIAPVHKVRNYYRWRFLVRFVPDVEYKQPLLAWLTNTVNDYPQFKKVKIIIDCDPYEFA